MKRIPFLASALALTVPAMGALTNNLVAYYDFNETGNAGLVNRANPGTFDAVFNGTTGSGENTSGSGFAGNTAFNGGDGLSSRTVLSSSLGGVLNLVDTRGNFISTGVSSATTGSAFTISLWFALTPGAANNSNRYHLLESANNYNVSLGTNTVTGTITAPSASYSYLAYVNQSTATVNATGVSTSTWHHAVLTYVSGTVTLYIDGANIGSLANGASNLPFTDLLFGRERNNPDPSGDRDWDGMIDELAIWNRALDPSEINNANTGSSADSLYQRGLAGLAVPEPSAVLLGGLGMLALLRRRSR